MHWLTAIFGFLACYFAAGLAYTLSQHDRIEDASSEWFWGIALIAAIIAAIVNQLRTRRRAARKVQGDNAA